MIKMNKYIKLYKKYKEIILYVIFGALTTAINILVFYLCNDILQIDYKFSNVSAWFMSVLFAFITNKLIVFESKNKSKKETTKEVISFFLARIISLIIDMLLMIMLIDIIKIDSFISKVIVNIVVVIINYILSKFLIFKKEG